MTFNQIKKLQKENGYAEMQKLINSGDVWKFEGSMGRAAMESLESGACMLPDKYTYDYYGNKLPPRTILKQGSKGTFQNSVNFYLNLY
jgi:hypothetical protein